MQGYVTIKGGIRVGVCGEAVEIDDKLKTLKNISSLNFRFPHLLKNCRYLLIKKAIKSKNILAKRVTFMYNNIKKQVGAVFS